MPESATAGLRVLLSGIDHPEGVAWWASERSLVYGTEAGEIWSYDVAAASARRLASGGGFILGIAVGPDDAIYACDMTHSCVHRYEPESTELIRFASGGGDAPMRVPNFPAFAGERMYVSDSGSCWDAADGTIWAVTPDGNATRVIDGPLSFPNGLAVTPDGSRLLCIETFPPRLLAFTITANGCLADQHVVAELPGTVPDGLVLTSTGDVLIACYRPDCILRLSAASATPQTYLCDPHGRLLAGCSNLCFFDDGFSRLAVANVAGTHLTEIVGRDTGSPLLSRKETGRA